MDESLESARLCWIGAGALPPLAVAIAMSTHATRQAFGGNASVSEAVQAIQATSSFDACAEQLRRDLHEPLIGTEVARRQNAIWLTEAFSSRRKATLVFGEPLSPLDQSHGPARERMDLDPTVSHRRDVGDNPVRSRW